MLFRLIVHDRFVERHHENTGLSSSRYETSYALRKDNWKLWTTKDFGTYFIMMKERSALTLSSRLRNMTDALETHGLIVADGITEGNSPQSVACR